MRELLERRLRAVANLDAGDSTFGPGPGFWVDAKEILNFDADATVDLRLTRGEIRTRRPALRADPRVRLRPNSSADWLEIRCTTPDDVDFVIELVEVAIAAHLPSDGRTPRPVPMGADLERRRRFH
jgi:hypothetical protein